MEMGWKTRSEMGSLCSLPGNTRRKRVERFKRFHEVAAAPGDYAEGWKKKKGGRIMAFLCSYAPEEILVAANILGYRLFGTKKPIIRADAHLQSYSCTLVRGVLEEALAQRLDFIDGIVFPHTCDSIQRLSDIWRMNLKGGCHMDLVLPVDLTTPTSLDYMTTIMEDFARDLEQRFDIEITLKDLERAISTCNAIRRSVMEIYALKERVPGSIAGADLHAMVKAGMVMDRNEYLTLVKGLADELTDKFNVQAQDQAVEFQGKRIVLSGGLCNMPDLYTVIERAGGRVVMDDLCTGTRFFQGSVEPDENIFRAIARRYHGRIVCPSKHSGIRTRGETLVKMVEKSRANGVMFFCLKFCDPFGFDYPYIKELLDNAGVPSMLFELEDAFVADGQLQTRCEAFMEML